MLLPIIMGVTLLIVIAAHLYIHWGENEQGQADDDEEDGSIDVGAW